MLYLIIKISYHLENFYIYTCKILMIGFVSVGFHTTFDTLLCHCRAILRIHLMSQLNFVTSPQKALLDICSVVTATFFVSRLYVKIAAFC